MATPKPAPETSTEEKKKTCFMIMPISTPVDLVPKYGDDPKHFIHVMDELFVPAIEECKFKPIRPIMKGGEVIHSEIIRNLENADLVLCDMSALNPNVFFELGIRTALDKPVALVKDEFLPKVPFDVEAPNHHLYKGSLRAYELRDEIPKLAEHLKETLNRSENRNAIWKHFGISARADPAGKDMTGADKFAAIADELSRINKEIASIRDGEVLRPRIAPIGPKEASRRLSKTIRELCLQFGYHFVAGEDWLDDELTITVMEEVKKDNDPLAALIQNAYIAEGLNAPFVIRFRSL